MASQKLTACTIHQSDIVDWNQVIANLDSTNSEQQQCVFTEQSTEYIAGYYIRKLSHRQLQYNIEGNCFEPVIVENQCVLKFDIYISHGTMMLWGNTKLANFFMTLFSQSTDNQLIIDYCKTDYCTMINRIIGDPDIKLARMKIRDIIIEDGIVANCSVNLSNTDTPSKLVKKYIKQISQLTVHLKGSNEDTSLTIYSSGSVVVFKDRTGLAEETLDKIEKIVGGPKDNG